MVRACSPTHPEESPRMLSEGSGQQESGVRIRHGLYARVRLHTFTSPFQVLVPAILNFVTGNSSDTLVIWLFRFLNFGALGVTAVWLWQIGKQQKLAPVAIALLVGLFSIDAKIVDFSINGMETGMMMFCLVLTFRAMLIPSRRQSLLLGAAWAGLMWTRPDSCIYIALLGGRSFLTLSLLIWLAG